MRLLLTFLFSAQLTFGQTHEVKLFDFKSSTCDKESDSERLRTRIIAKELQGDLLTIKIAATATCCVDFNPVTGYENGTINLDIEETGTACECLCCYEFTYQVKGISNGEVKITFREKEIELSTEKYLTFPIEYKILDGDTINLVDKYGLRQGIWILPNDNLRTMLYEFLDDRPIRRVRYYPNGNILSEMVTEKIRFKVDDIEYFEYADFNRYTEYYESGQIKKECYNDSKSNMNSYEKGKCKEWNEKGKLIYEGEFRE